MTISRTELITARHIVHYLERKQADYEEDCERDRKEGHRPHYCEHGMNLWTDYDPICGYCEEGMHLSNPMFLRTHALAQAKQFHHKLSELNNAYHLFSRHTPDYPESLQQNITDAYLSAFNQLCKEYGVYNDQHLHDRSHSG